jgi:hypothetical protein
MMDWFGIALAKFWEGFWTTVGAGVALGLGVASGITKKLVHYFSTVVRQEKAEENT